MIRKGEPWGEPVALAGCEVTVGDDAALAALIGAALESGAEPGPVLITGGDLHRSLGGRPAPEPHALPIDLLDVDLDGVRRWAVAHVSAHRPWWRGECLVAMNGSHLGTWNLGPRAHPNDGLVDVTIGSLSLRDRLSARRRAPLGAHLPHPELSTSRVASVTWTARRPVPVFLDGVRTGSVRRLTVRVVPDAGTVVVG